MADYNSGNFLNPDYSTPEQVAQMREYAKQLQTGAIDSTAKHWTGVLAHALMGYQGQGKVDQANQLQRQLLQQGQEGLQQAGNVNPMVAALLGQPQNSPAQPPMMQQGQSAPPQQPVQAAQSMQPANLPVGDPSTASRSEIPSSPKVWGDKEAIAAGLYDDPALPSKAKPQQYSPQQGGDLSAFYMNPSIPNELKKGVQEGLTPKVVSDVYGRPGSQTPLGGIQGRPVTGQYKPGIMVPVSVGSDGSVATQIPMTAPGSSGGSPNYGGASGIGGAVEPIAEIGRNLGNQSTFNKAATVPQAEAIANDQKDAATAPQVFRVVNTIIDDLNSHGNAMSMGPTANWTTEAKKVIANLAPNLMSKQQLEGMAANEAMDKASSTLGTLLGKQVGGLTGGTDASMFEGLKQVPGAHNSLVGAKALADMIKQGAVLQQKWGEAYRSLPRGIKTAPDFDYIGERNRFYQKNPILNPLTGNDIVMDMRASQSSKPETQPGSNPSFGGYRIVR